MSNGVKLYQDKNWEAAIAEFEAAYRTKPKASPLVNIALCYKGQFRYPEAITTLEKALAKHGDSMSAGDKKAAEDAIAELKGLIGFVTLKVAPSNAMVSVDGEDLAKDAASKPIPLGPGTHKLRAHAEGYADAEKQVSVTSGEKDKVVELTLTPDKGWVSVIALDAKHAIAVDQKSVGFGKWSGFLTPGTHLVQIYKPGSQTGFSHQVTVAAGKVVEVKEGDPTLAPSFYPGFGADVKPPDKPPPVFHGFYGMATAGFVGVLGEMAGDFGYAVGGRLGWRPNTVIGLEGMLQYSHIGGLSGGEGSAITEGDEFRSTVSPEITMDSLRLGGNLRFMTRGRVARFVATVGPGLAFDALDYGTCSDSDFDPAFYDCFDEDNSGVGFYVNTEFGLEFDIRGLFFGVALQQMFSSLGGLTGPDIGDVQGHIGLHLRVGYGTW